MGEVTSGAFTSERRENDYAQLVVLLLNQGRYKEAADLMERHEKRREWEASVGR